MGRFLSTLRRNLWWCVLSLLIVPVIAGWLGHRYLRSFDATAAIWVDGPSTANTTDPTAPKSTADSYATTFQELLQTRAFQEEVVQGVAAQNGVSISAGSIDDARLARIRTNTTVAATGPNLITVDYKDTDAATAEVTSKVLVGDLQTEALNLKRNAAQRMAQLYDQQIAQARASLTSADVASVLSAPVPDSVGLSQAVDLQSQLNQLSALEAKRNTDYAQSVADTLAVSATLHVIDAPNVQAQAKTNWTQVALAVIAAMIVALAVDAGVLTLLMLTDSAVHGEADLTALTTVAIAEIPRVQPYRISDRWS